MRAFSVFPPARSPRRPMKKPPDYVPGAFPSSERLGPAQLGGGTQGEPGVECFPWARI